MCLSLLRDFFIQFICLHFLPLMTPISINAHQFFDFCCFQIWSASDQLRGLFHNQTCLMYIGKIYGLSSSGGICPCSKHCCATGGQREQRSAREVSRHPGQLFQPWTIVITTKKRPLLLWKFEEREAICFFDLSFSRSLWMPGTGLLVHQFSPD